MYIYICRYIILHLCDLYYISLVVYQHILMNVKMQWLAGRTLQALVDGLREVYFAHDCS